MVRRTKPVTMRGLVILGVLGILFIGGGAYGYSTSDEAPTCDGHTMTHHTICDVTTNGVTRHETYEDMQSDNTVGSIIAMAAGGLLLVIAVIGAIRFANQRKAVVAGSMPYMPGMGYPAQPGAGYPAQPGQQFVPPPGYAMPNGQAAPYGQPSYGQPQYPAQPGQYPTPPGQYPQYPPPPGQYPPPPGQYPPPGQFPPPGQYPPR